MCACVQAGVRACVCTCVCVRACEKLDLITRLYKDYKWLNMSKLNLKCSLDTLADLVD